MGRRAAHLYKWPTGQKPILDADSPWQDKQLIYDGYKLVEERYLSGGNAGELIRRYYYEPGINKLAAGWRRSVDLGWQRPGGFSGRWLCYVL